MTENTATPSVDLLQDLEEDWQYQDASTLQRFINYTIDLICYYGLVFGVFFAIVFITRDESVIDWLDSIPPMVDRLFSLVMFGILMSVIEGVSMGRSVGKLVTGTKAIRDDGRDIGWSEAFARGCSRMVPFEPVSALWGNPWHDKWSNTRVVKLRK